MENELASLKHDIYRTKRTIQFEELQLKQLEDRLKQGQELFKDIKLEEGQMMVREYANLFSKQLYHAVVEVHPSAPWPYRGDIIWHLHNDKVIKQFEFDGNIYKILPIQKGWDADEEE